MKNRKFRGILDIGDYEMRYYEYKQSRSDIIVEPVYHFCLDDILRCGQAFRWRMGEDGIWSGIAFGRLGRVSQRGDRLVFHNTPLSDFLSVWRRYFDLDRDYGALKARLCEDRRLARAVAYTPGMRVLRQEPWEALCSFILSQNNNIKRICGLVDRLCESFGQPVDGGFAFPEPGRLAPLDVEDLAPVRAGFRAKYILDAARRVSDGRLDLDAVSRMPAEEARAALTSIHGVGAKVADCALLYGMNRVECFPQDVWIKRVMAAMFPGGLPAGLLPEAGLAQQYLFHYARHNSLDPEPAAV